MNESEVVRCSTCQILKERWDKTVQWIKTIAMVVVLLLVIIAFFRFGAWMVVTTKTAKQAKETIAAKDAALARANERGVYYEQLSDQWRSNYFGTVSQYQDLVDTWRNRCQSERERAGKLETQLKECQEKGNSWWGNALTNLTATTTNFVITVP